MRILGLDIATTTGWAYSSGRNSGDIISGSFKGVGDDVFCKSNSLDDQFKELIKRYGKADLCVLEKPLGKSANPRTLAALWLYFGGLKGLCRGYNMPCELAPVSTWRKSMFGFARKPGWESKHYKAHAKMHCEKFLKVKVKNSDQAEAVLISQYGFYTQYYKQMVSEAVERDQAALI